MNRFIILSSARTGSTLLTSLLNGHEKIKVYPELFNLDELEEKNLFDALEDPIAYLTKFYSNQKEEVDVAGFKIFYDHLTKEYFDKKIHPEIASQHFLKKIKAFQRIMNSYSLKELMPKFRKTWKHLREDQPLKIIHLKRKNKLQSLVSLKLAMLTNQWVLLKEDEKNPTSVCELSYEECDLYFQRISSHEIYYKEFFADHDCFEVTYEQLVTEQEEIMNQLFQFLEVANKGVSSYLKKQNTQPLSKKLTNYHQLKEKFTGSQWEEYFFE